VAIWYILWLLGIFSRFGMLKQAKSGKPWRQRRKNLQAKQIALDTTGSRSYDRELQRRYSPSEIFSASFEIRSNLPQRRCCKFRTQSYDRELQRQRCKNLQRRESVFDAKISSSLKNVQSTTAPALQL
jgi:hypothetical protein